MPRFFVPPENIHGQTFTLTGSEARHAALVLRKKAGDTIEFFDGKDLSYTGQIQSVSPERVDGVVLKKQTGVRSPLCDLTLYQALIKGPKWDWLVEKASEIGVARLVPIVTARTIVHPSRETALDRWQRIALAAAKQCGRTDVMNISCAVSLGEALSSASSEGLTLIPWEKENSRTIRQACRDHKGSSLRLFIGPEGGWETGEVERAIRHGALSVTLGPTLLRSETAGLVASALALAECGLHS